MPEVRYHSAGTAADEKHQIRFEQCAIGTIARVAARNPDRQGVAVEDRPLCIERGDDRDLKLLGQRDDLGLCAGSNDTATCHDDRFFRPTQCRHGIAHAFQSVTDFHLRRPPL